MSFVFKSAVGLGAVYLAMFNSAPQPSKLEATAAICASAVKSSLSGADSLSAHWAATRCAVSLSDESARRLSSPTTTAPLRTDAPKSEKAENGTLTEGDLRDAWFGPAKLSRKVSSKG